MVANMHKHIWVVLFLCVLVLGFVVRLYKINNPIADWHAWRQADTSAVSRNFVLSGFDVLHPRFDDLSNVPSGLDNPKGYRFVEFPFYNVLQAGGYRIVGILTLEEWGRLITSITSLFSSLLLFLIVRKRCNERAGFFAAFFFLFLPYNIYYSRVILPDPMAVTAFLAAIYFFLIAIDKKLNFVSFSVSLFFAAASILIKPPAAFFLLPIAVLAYEAYGWKLVTKWYLWVFVLLSIGPFVAWRVWMSQYPEGIPVFAWLLNGGNIRFTGAYFYWIFADRFARLILGYWGVVFFVFGVIRNYSRANVLFFFSFLASTILYLIIIARGNVQHDYYQIFIIPSLTLFMGLGVDLLLNKTKETTHVAQYAVVLIASIFTFMFGWYFVRDYYNINNSSMLAAGQAVDKLTPKNAKIIAPLDGDTSFLYQTKRKGWASFEKGLPEMITMGAEYLVLLNPTQQDKEGLGKEYSIVALTPQYLILQLSQKQ